jgi:hypothetical protein
MEKKQTTSISDLCRGYPVEFVRYFEHARSMQFNEKPDYNYLKSLMQRIWDREKFTNINTSFDWETSKIPESIKSRPPAPKELLNHTALPIGAQKLPPNDIAAKHVPISVNKVFNNVTKPINNLAGTMDVGQQILNRYKEEEMAQTREREERKRIIMERNDRHKHELNDRIKAAKEYLIRECGTAEVLKESKRAASKGPVSADRSRSRNKDKKVIEETSLPAPDIVSPPKTKDRDDVHVIKGTKIIVNNLVSPEVNVHATGPKSSEGKRVTRAQAKKMGLHLS